ncbi:MAG: XdhC family protein [Exilibacterium sp.]
MPDDVVSAIAPDQHTAIVALTHDPRLAEHFGFGETQLVRLRGPVGLPIGSKTPAEIAVAVAADLIAVSRGIDLVSIAPLRGNHEISRSREPSFGDGLERNRW